MVKPVIIKRAVKGTPLTYAELDTNFQNLDDATVTLKAGTGGTDVVSDLNGVITLVAGSGITLAGDNTAKTVTVSTTESQNIFQNIAVAGQSTVSADTTSDTLTLVAGTNVTITTNATTDTITVNSLGGDVVNDLSPQLGGDLDVNSFQITSNISSPNISINPYGTGLIVLSAATTVVGETSGVDSVITSNGASDLRLKADNTNSGANFIEIQDGAAGDIAITVTGTGVIQLNAPLKIAATTGTPTTFENGYYEDMLQTPVDWLKINIGSISYYIPLFQ